MYEKAYTHFSLQIQLLESLQESWTEYENNVQCLKTWFETQEKKLKQQQKIGDQASVQNALKDCQVMSTCKEQCSLSRSLKQHLINPCEIFIW